MPPRDWRLRLEEIIEALERIEQYSRGMTLESFSANTMAVDAVVRNLTVVGEATRHIPLSVQARYPDVPWAEMRALRNILIHEYFGVSVPILWETVSHDLPPLRPLLVRMLGEERDA